MTNEENLILLRRYRNDGDIPSRNTLIENNLGLVQTILESMGKAKYYEDCLSYVFVEMVKCLDNFDESYRTKLSTLLWHYIKTGIFLFFRENHVKEIKYLPVTLEKDPIDLVIEEETRHRVWNAIETLPPQEREIVSRFFGIGCIKETFREISTTTDYTVGQVQATKNRAIRRLQEIF